jgi:hypothetical protein
MSQQVIDFALKRKQRNSLHRGEIIKMRHNELRNTHQELLHEASRSDYTLQVKLEEFLFQKLKLRRNSKEAVALLTRFTTMKTTDVTDCIIWYSKVAHVNYSPKKGKVSKYFLACITNYLESKKPTHSEVKQEADAYAFMKSLEELDGI